MTSGTSASCPFVAGSKIEEPTMFVGRKVELDAIISRMTGVQPTSVNVVGEERIGKSSLLYHFYQTWDSRVENPKRYVVIYLDLQDAVCQQEEQFYQAVTQQLQQRVQGIHSFRNLWRIQATDRQTFADAIKQWKTQGVLPVLCLDKFEALLQHRDQFNNGFYDNLRSLMNGNALMLVVASKEKLDVYRHRYGLISDFFNLGHVLLLGELTEKEAKDLVYLPASKVINTSPALREDEQRLALEWGKRHPFLLQLAGRFLWEARQQGLDTNSAKVQFDGEASRVPRRRFDFSQWWKPLRWLFWDVPIRLGRLAKFIGGTVDDVSNWIIGFALLVLVVLVFVGVVNGNQVGDFVRDKLGIK